MFDYPRVEPAKAHFSTLKPIPYRPFKWGDYQCVTPSPPPDPAAAVANIGPSVTMGIRSLPWDEWIELDRDFPQVHRVVEHRIQTRGARVLSVNAAQPAVVASGQAAGELSHLSADERARS